MAERFQLVAGNLALDFANTLDNRYDAGRLVDLLPDLERLLAFAAQSGIISEPRARKLLRKTSAREGKRITERATELRETLYFLFRSIALRRSPSRSCLQTLNCFLADAHVVDVIVWHKAEFVRRRGESAKTADGLLWPILDAAVKLLTSPDRRHISECCEKKCRWLFLDRSKNHSRWWCDMRVCGNRAKVRRFHARRRKK